MVLTFDEIAALCEDRELFGRVVTQARYTHEEAARISAAFAQIYKRQVVRTCGNCLGDALAEMVALYRKNKEQMRKQNECRYTLRAGMLIRLNFGDSVYYSNANLTDEVAEKYIMAKPSRLADFSKYPESIVKRIESVKDGRPEDTGTPKPKSKSSARKGNSNAKGTAPVAGKAESEKTPVTERQ